MMILLSIRSDLSPKDGKAKVLKAFAAGIFVILRVCQMHLNKTNAAPFAEGSLLTRS